MGTTAPRLSRRRWLRRAGLAAATGAGAIALDTFWWEPHWLQLVERDLPLRNLAASWQGRTLAQISDVHVGPQVSDAYVLESFAQVARLAPDVVVMTGDFLTIRDDGTPPWDQVERVYQHFPRGRIATLAVLGNHDFGLRWKQPHVAHQLVEIVSPFGIRPLRNEVADLDGLVIGGLDDLWSDLADPNRMLPSMHPDAAGIVLCHNPDGADRLDWQDYSGWILSGHTHGGQCKPPFLPPPLLPVLNRRYTSGEFSLAGGRRMYINRGLGHLLRARFNVRPEITAFRMMNHE